MLEEYNKTVWKNGQAPARNDTNLNNQENGIEAVTNETIAQNEAIEELQAPSKTIYTPEPTDPTPHTKGTLFYSDDAHSLAYYNDIQDMTLNIGQETIVRVFNDTGSTIVNGAVLRAGGDSINGVPTAVLALADSLENGTAGAVATHDIPDQTEGFATLTGSVSGIDTSAFTVGDKVYLSDTVAGGYTKPAPEVASYVGVILVADPANGVILVNPNSLINLPTLSADMQQLTNPTISVTATPQKFVNFANETGIVMSGDATNGTITALYNGGYEAKAMAVIRDINGSNNSQSIDFYLRINESAVNERLYPLIIGRNGEETSGTPFFEINLNAGDTVSLWYGSDTINEDVTIESITFSLKSVNVR